MLRIFLVSLISAVMRVDDKKYFPDGMEGEQTWPTEEEIMAAENKTRKVSLRSSLLPLFNPYWLLD